MWQQGFVWLVRGLHAPPAPSPLPAQHGEPFGRGMHGRSHPTQAGRQGLSPKAAPRPRGSQWTPHSGVVACKAGMACARRYHPNLALPGQHQGKDLCQE